MSSPGYFDQDEGAPPAGPQEPQDGGGDAHDQDQDSEQTALLPKSFFREEDLHPGYKCEVEVTAVHEEEVSVKMAETKSEEEEALNSESPELAGPAPAPAGGGGGMFE
jgi:hypothetical protein